MRTLLRSQTISVPEAGRILGLSRLTAYKCAAAGQIPALRLGKQWRVPVAALEKMLNGEQGGEGDER